jgi:hypothetical protein
MGFIGTVCESTNKFVDYSPLLRHFYRSDLSLSRINVKASIMDPHKDIKVFTSTVTKMIAEKYHPKRYLAWGSKPALWKSVKTNRVCEARTTMHSLKISILICFWSSRGR